MIITALPKLKNLLKDCFVLADKNVYSRYAEYLPEDVFITRGEEDKNFAFAERVTAEMLRRNVGRGGKLAAVGGGATGDLGGFVASVYMRGIKWICVPTTVLAMADSAQGGKTAVNVAGIKNAAGSFYLPENSFYCKEFLASLPDDERDSGLCEIYKTALIDGKVFAAVEAELSIFELAVMSAQAKRGIVGEDFRDEGKRRLLNIGHTVGHAIELEYGVKHGFAVAAGMRAESIFWEDYYLAQWIEERTLPLFPKNYYDERRLIDAAMRDKKNRGGITISAPDGEIEFSPEEFAAKLREKFSCGDKLCF